MENLIKLIPLIYAVWTGILIASGAAISLGLYKVIRLEKIRGELNNRNDEINLIACTAICTINALTLFAQQELVTYILEALIMGQVYITAYFSYLIYRHLRILPSLSKEL